jgi:hypothetical protein
LAALASCHIYTRKLFRNPREFYMQAEMSQLLSESADRSLALSQVIERLNDAMRLFAEGEPEQGCQCLTEAIRVLDSCGDDGMANSADTRKPSRSVELEEHPADLVA